MEDHYKTKKEEYLEKAEEERLNNAIEVLKGVYETPENYTYSAKVSFDPQDYKDGQPISVTLTFENDDSIRAKIDSEYCVEFDVLINNAIYDVTVAEIWDEYIIFDYEIKNKTKVYDLATSQSLMLPASYEYKVNSKLVYEISGEVVNIRNSSSELSLYSYDDKLLYEGIVVYDDELRKNVSFQTGEYIKMTVLRHETSLSVLHIDTLEKIGDVVGTRKLSNNIFKELRNERNTFLSSMMFPKFENEKYFLKLKDINSGEQLVGNFKSYFELFDYVNRTSTRETMSLSNKRNSVWSIGRVVSGCDLAAQWTLSMNNEVLFYKYYGNYHVTFNDEEYGKVYSKLCDLKKEYYIYLGMLKDSKYKFIKISIDETDETQIDMDCEVEQEEFANMHRVTYEPPEIVSTTTKELLLNPHNYFYWMFYWKSFSKWGSEEQNKSMLQIIMKV